MSYHRWLNKLQSSAASAAGHRRRSRVVRKRVTRSRLRLECLEHRRLLAFGAPAIFDAEGNAYAIVSADFNNDQRPDLATANYGDGTVSVLLGDEQGGFGDASHFAVGRFAYSLAVGDFDEDGNLDLATGNLLGYDGVNFQSLSVLMGNGNGTFDDAKTITPVSVPTSVAVGDFNADGNLDLAVGGWNDIYGSYYGSVSFHAGDGYGNFSQA